MKEVEKETPQAKTTRLPTAGNVSTLIKQALNYDKRIGEISGELGDLIKSYKKDKHVDPGAFRIVKAMFALSDEKLSVRLAHLMHYIEFAKDASGKTLTERANMQGKLFDDEREADEDGEPDLRPRFRRQPGASGADIDEAELAAGADNVRPLKPH
jgi:hypothetical protein